MTPSSLATCPHRIARRLDFRETGHFMQASTNRSSFAGRCFAAHLWQTVLSLNIRAFIVKIRPARNPRVEMTVSFHGNNRCIVQQSLQPLAQERRQRDGPCSGLPAPPMASQASLAAYKHYLSPSLKRLSPTEVPVSDNPAQAKGSKC